MQRETLTSQVAIYARWRLQGWRVRRYRRRGPVCLGEARKNRI